MGLANGSVSMQLHLGPLESMTVSVKRADPRKERDEWLQPKGPTDTRWTLTETDAGVGHHAQFNMERHSLRFFTQAGR